MKQLHINNNYQLSQEEMNTLNGGMNKNELAVQMTPTAFVHPIPTRP